MQSLRIAESSRLLRTSLFASNCAKDIMQVTEAPWCECHYYQLHSPDEEMKTNRG